MVRLQEQMTKGMAHSAKRLHRPQQLLKMESPLRTMPRSPPPGAVKHLWNLRSCASSPHNQRKSTQRQYPYRCWIMMHGVLYRHVSQKGRPPCSWMAAFSAVQSFLSRPHTSSDRAISPVKSDWPPSRLCCSSAWPQYDLGQRLKLARSVGLGRAVAIHAGHACNEEQLLAPASDSSSCSSSCLAGKSLRWSSGHEYARSKLPSECLVNLDCRYFYRWHTL